MKVSVWDTYVKRNDGLIMHFDVLVPSEITDETVIFSYGQKYIMQKPFGTGHLTAKECRFCHIEEANQSMIEGINKDGFYIIEMENCL